MTTQSRGLELDEVQRELEATDTSNLSEALGTRDAHIKELEKKLFAKEREVISLPLATAKFDREIT